MTSRNANPSPIRPKILAVDDEEVIGYLIRRVVLQMGYEVEWVTDCQTALKRLSTDRFDLILSDFKMPGMTGEEFYYALASIEPALLKKLVFITGDTITSKTLKFLKTRAIPYLSKPFELHKLEALIRKMVNGE
ncbi:MAG TPA: response regulator [bacterium]